MKIRRLSRWAFVAAFGAHAGFALAAAPMVEHPQAETQALDLAKRAIAMRSVAGPGDETPKVAALFADALIKGGFRPKDVQIIHTGNTAYLVARWPGSDPNLKPVVLLGHMDVVEAQPKDWQRDPFTPVVEGGYLFGRGSTDMKLDDTLAIATLAELRRQGFKPRRSIVVAFSGDEETTMRTGALIADQLRDAELVLNVDGANGVLDEHTGKPAYFTWEGAEKTYADFEMTVTNPGGHSSEPRAVNAIDELASALLRLQAHRFKPEINALTRAYFEQAAQWEKPETGAAMRAFAANPGNQKAIDVLSAEPSMIGKIGTTCVVTMVKGGHALNALPQRASANINCRIFPGHPRPAIMQELSQAANDPQVQFKDVTEGSVATEASPIRPDVVSALQTAVENVYPGLPVVAAMSSGASDSMWFRAKGVPSYGISPIFIKNSDEFAHGLNERTPIETIRPSLDILLSTVSSLTR